MNSDVQCEMVWRESERIAEAPEVSEVLASFANGSAEAQEVVSLVIAAWNSRVAEEAKLRGELALEAVAEAESYASGIRTQLLERNAILAAVSTISSVVGRLARLELGSSSAYAIACDEKLFVRVLRDMHPENAGKPAKRRRISKEEQQ